MEKQLIGVDISNDRLYTGLFLLCCTQFCINPLHICRVWNKKVLPCFLSPPRQIGPKSLLSLCLLQSPSSQPKQSSNIHNTTHKDRILNKTVLQDTFRSDSSNWAKIFIIIVPNSTLTITTAKPAIFHQNL